MALPKVWTDEAYVSLHLVQAVFREVVPTESSEWYPEYVISPRNRVDFYIKDRRRQLEFFIEVKAAKAPDKSGLDAAASQQLATYFHHTSVKHGILIDPFGIECYQVAEGYPHLTEKFAIEDPTQLAPITKFLQQYLNNLTNMRTIVIHASKGGVGKTTLTTNIAFELARRNNRVLVIDLDDQANSSLSLGVNKADEIDKVKTPEDFEKILDSFQQRKELIDFLTQCRNADFDHHNYIYPSTWNKYLPRVDSEDNEPIIQTGCIDVLPGSYRTEPIVISNDVLPQKLLNKALQQAKADYDYVIIDTSPAYNAITKNGMFAAQYLLIPSQMEYLSTYGIRQPVRYAYEIAEIEKGERCNILGIVPMMTDRTLRNKSIKGLVKKNFKDIPLLQEISRVAAVGQAQYKRVPLFIHAEQNKSQGASVAKQAADLTQEIIKRIDSLSAT